MRAEYWLQRWREGRTGWHQQDVLPLLPRHWPALGVAPGERVLVPLCGKSLDMLWLSRQGLRVLGVELSPVAIDAFLAENHLHAHPRIAADGTHYEIAREADGDIELVNGDVFDVDPDELAHCRAFYDRAATIALPADLRERLATNVYGRLPAGSRGLLITLDYPAGAMSGPPFSVDADEVQRLFAKDWKIESLERRDILAGEPAFREAGLSALHTAVYALTRRPA